MIDAARSAISLALSAPRYHMPLPLRSHDADILRSCLAVLSTPTRPEAKVCEGEGEAAHTSNRGIITVPDRRMTSAAFAMLRDVLVHGGSSCPGTPARPRCRAPGNLLASSSDPLRQVE